VIHWFSEKNKKKKQNHQQIRRNTYYGKTIIMQYARSLLLVNAKPRGTIYQQIFVAILQTALHFIEVNVHLRVFDIQNDGVIT